MYGERGLSFVGIGCDRYGISLNLVSDPHPSSDMVDWSMEKSSTIVQRAVDDTTLVKPHGQLTGVAGGFGVITTSRAERLGPLQRLDGMLGVLTGPGMARALQAIRLTLRKSLSEF
jgi:hypothetical protein